MEFRLLGAVEVRDGGELVTIGGLKSQVLFATLLLDHGRVVPAQRLVDAVWGVSPPASARSLIQTYIAGLRRTFAGNPSLIATRGPGYLVQIEPEELDLYRFEQLTAQARAAVGANRHDEAAGLFHTALSLWRGGALSGLDSEMLASEAARLDELRLVVQEEWIALKLHQRGHSELVADLTGLVHRHPTREALRGHLMVALYRSGRQADALVTFREGRKILVEQLGIEPGAALRSVHEAILRDDETLLAPPYRTEPGAADGRPASVAEAAPDSSTNVASPAEPILVRTAVPAQLPPVPADFTGRTAARQDVMAHLSTQDADALPTVVIAGAGGVGKSTLAARVAHDLALGYPDGQLFVQLHGMSTTPTIPDAVLARFLVALGDADDRLPATLEGRSERFRSLVAGRRVLVVLDDAASEAQIRPLLPGWPTCGVLITSRSRLPGLPGAHQVELGVLAADEALELLARIVGQERVQAESAEARRLTDQCGRLALAVRIAGMRLVGRQHWTMTTLARRLGDERHRLDELQIGDQEVRASIGLSYEALDPVARVAARRLGLLGLPDFPSWIVAAVLDVDPDEGERALERLLDGRFVDFAMTDEVGQERYQMHDLLRLFAAERAMAEDEPAQLADAVRRVISGWVRAVHHIAATHPSGHVVPLAAGANVDRDKTECGAESSRLSTMVTAPDRPRAWFNAEQHALIASVERAAAMQLDDAATLAIALSRSVFSTANLFEAWTRTHDAALTVVRRSGNRAAEAALLNGYGQLRYEQDRFTEARTYYLQALAAFREIGDGVGEAATLAGIATACREQGYLPEALHFLAQARELLLRANDAASLASVARLTGSVLLEQGDFAAADANLREALAAFRAIGGRRGEALTLRTIGLVHRAREEYERAYELCAHARAIFRELGDELLEAYSVQAMAKAQIRLGRQADALDPLLKALGVCRANADRYGEALCLRTLGELQLSSGDLAEAGEKLQAALRLWRAMDLPLPRARALRDLARVACAEGNLDSARVQLAEAEEITRLHGAHEHAEISGMLAKLQRS